MTRGRYEVTAAREGEAPRRPAGPCPCSRKLCVVLVVLVVLVLAAAGVGAIYHRWKLHRNVIYAADGSKLYRGGEGITEGDMLDLNTSDPRQLSAARDYRRLWPGGSVPYRLDPAIGCPSSRRCEALQSALKEYNSRTCVRWEPAREGDPKAAQLIFRPNSGCFSHVGYRGALGDSQVIVLGNGCFNKGILLHLLGHTLGLWHEHNRPDRDSWMAVNMSNVDEQHLKSFNKFNASQHHIVDQLDFSSVMMFGSWAFSSGSGPTIASHWSAEPLPEVWEKSELSQLDVNRVQSMYIRQCSRRDRSREVT